MGDPTFIPDEAPRTDLSECIYPSEYEGHLDSLMINHDMILDRVRALALVIHNDYKGRRPILVCILKGACPFYQHLLDALMDLRQGFFTEFLRVSSYHGTSTTGKVNVSGAFKVEDFNGRDVILVEDIIDTGTTLSQLIPMLKEQCPSMKSVEICSLLSKRLPEPAKVEAKYVGFNIPNHFIIGYGLDYNELYRDLKDIWIISKAGIQFDSKTL